MRQFDGGTVRIALQFEALMLAAIAVALLLIVRLT
jgi:hypothetical protein